MISRLLGTDRIEVLASQLAAMSGELGALRDDIAGLVARVEAAAGQDGALRAAVDALGERAARLEARADAQEAGAESHDERLLAAAGRWAEEAAARAEAEREAQWLELLKLQMRLDAHRDDMAKTATGLVRQMAALNADGSGRAASPLPD